MKNTTVEIGKDGEQKALNYLKERGYIFIAKNYYTNFGEIDLIFMQRDILVFVEVKTRKNYFFVTGREAVNHKKQERIKKVANHFISANKINFREIRFDIIEYYTDDDVIEHFVDAF